MRAIAYKTNTIYTRSLSPAENISFNKTKAQTKTFLCDDAILTARCEIVLLLFRQGLVILLSAILQTVYSCISLFMDLLPVGNRGGIK